MAAAGLLLVGLFALHATWAPPWVAALGAVVGLAAVPWPGALSAWGEGEGLLALAFALPAVALLVGHASRSSAVAAGMLLAAAALAQPLLAAGMLLAAAVGLGRRGSAGRFVLAFALALALAAPGLWPLAQSLSLREVVALARAVRPGELLALAIGLALAASFPLALVRLAEPPIARRPTRDGPGWPWSAPRSWSPACTAGSRPASFPRTRATPWLAPRPGRVRWTPCARRKGCATGCRPSPGGRRASRARGFRPSTPTSGRRGLLAPAGPGWRSFISSR